MKGRYLEAPADLDALESCAGYRKGAGEALPGARAGSVSSRLAQDNPANAIRQLPVGKVHSSLP